MPSSKEHKDKADRNRAFLAGVEGSAADADWTAVVAFYLAVHLVERLSACENVHHSGHGTRPTYVRKKHGAIHTAFSALYDAAFIARYGTLNQFAKAFPGDTVKKVLVDRHLAAVENHVQSHFALPPSPPTLTGAGS